MVLKFTLQDVLIITIIIFSLASCGNNTADNALSYVDDSSKSSSLPTDSIAINKKKQSDSLLAENDKEKRKFDLNYCTTHLINLQTELQLTNNKLLLLQARQDRRSHDAREKKIQDLTLKMEDVKNRIMIWNGTIDKINSGKNYDMDANIKLMSDTLVSKEKADSLLR